MRVESENYGAIIILRVSGAVQAPEVGQFIQELAAKCTDSAHIIISLIGVECTPQVLAPLVVLREKQRWLKPNIWIISPVLAFADAKTINEALQGLDTPESQQINRLLTASTDRNRLEKRKVEIEDSIRELLGLTEGYKVEDFDTALALVKERNGTVKRRAEATATYLDRIKKASRPSEENAESEKRLRELKEKAYAAIRGE